MLHRILYFAAIIALVAFAQWLFAADFSEDELARIFVTTLGIGGIDVVAEKIRGK